MHADTVLLIPQKSDEERNSVLKAWIDLGGKGQRLDRFWEKPEGLDNKKLAVYGNDTFALVVAKIFNLELISPDDSLIGRLDKKWTKRFIQQKSIRDLNVRDFPNFIKPATPKQFTGKIYKTINEFAQETKGLSDSEQVLVSEIINVEAEARAFILNRDLLDVAIYEGEEDLKRAMTFLKDFLKDATIMLPKTFVIDIGYNTDLDWFIIEFNSSWGAGLNNCNPKKVIDAIIEATK